MLDPFQNLLHEVQIPLCQIHNLPGIFVNPDKNDTQRPVFCADCLTNHKKVEDQIKENKQIFLDIQNENNRKIDMLNLFIQSVNVYINNITQSLNKLKQSIADQINVIQNNQMRQKEQFIQSQCMLINPIIQDNNDQNQQFHEFNKKIIHQLEILKQNLQIENLNQCLQQNEKNQKNKKFQYSQVIDSISQLDQCLAIAINSQNSIVAVASHNKIRILEFKNEKLKEIQFFGGHLKNIKCLNFMKNSQQLVSACSEGKIIIWELSNNKQWQKVQILDEHKNEINCLQINHNENLIISGSDDKAIKFWKLVEKQWKCEQTLQMKEVVWNLSVNESNNKLIAIMQNEIQVQLFENDGNLWHKTQTIQLSKASLRLSFINDDQFAVQLWRSDLLYIFNFDQKSNQFKLGQEIKVNYGESDYTLFPMQFIKSKGILIDKNSKYINILQKQQNGEFNLNQTIEFGHFSLYGCASNDGEYLFTRDKYLKKVQVRKLEII